jgi:hypothetical protein
VTQEGGLVLPSLPDVFEHVEHLGRQVGVGHVKLCEVRLQHGGGWLLGLKDGHLLLKAQDPGEEESECQGGRGDTEVKINTTQGETMLCRERRKGSVRVDTVTAYFLAMLSIFCFFFRRGRDEEEVPTREEVDWDTWTGGEAGTSSSDADVI